MTASLPSRIVRRLRREIDAHRVTYLAKRYPLPTITLDELCPGNSAVQPPLMDDICMPPYYGVDDHDDYSALMHLAVRIRPEYVLELGTAYGNTIANLCRHCPNAHFFTVNAPVSEQTGTVITFELQKDDIGRAYRKSGDTQRVTQIFANTLHMDLKAYLSDRQIDLAIVDACHDENFVINDFLKVEPFMRRGGIVLLHDTDPSMNEHLKGSYVACTRLRRKGFDIRHLANTWWGVWKKP
jgi:predicted O-methyltransferase YrrM